MANHTKENEHLNVLGTSLQMCGCTPMTGFWRDGFCRTDIQDRGMHTVCCVVTEEFLEFSKADGNDLSTPMPQFNFPGLKPGDKWCLCAGRWLTAYKAGKACPIILEACHEETIAVVPMEALLEKAHKKA